MTPVLLIHGLFGSLSAPRILAAFGDRLVLAPDLLGYGAFRDQSIEEWTLVDQADHVAAYVLEHTEGGIDIIGHSVGGAVATIFAHRYPELTRSLTSVEGNLTLSDAFWSQKIACQALSDIEQEVEGFRADVAAWIGRSGVAPASFTLSTATAWLDNQPVSTLRTQARAVVSATADRDYLEQLRAVVDSGVPVHLVAGARSRQGWNVPDWLSARAASNTVIADTGHLMMLENPQMFADALLRNLDDDVAGKRPALTRL